MADECKGLETEVVIKVKGAKALKYRLCDVLQKLSRVLFLSYTRVVVLIFFIKNVYVEIAELLHLIQIGSFFSFLNSNKNLDSLELNSYVYSRGFSRLGEKTSY